MCKIQTRYVEIVIVEGLEEIEAIIAYQVLEALKEKGIKPVRLRSLIWIETEYSFLISSTVKDCSKLTSSVWFGVG